MDLSGKVNKMPKSSMRVTAKLTKSSSKQSIRPPRNCKPPAHFSDYVTNMKSKQLPITKFCIKTGDIQSSSCKQLAEEKGIKTSESKISITEVPKIERNNNSHNNKSKKQTFKRNISGSFDKYGMCLPNFEDILEYQKAADQDKLMIDDLTHTMSIPLEAVDVTLEKPTKPDNILDCKHLSKEGLRKSFLSNLKHIKAIIHGTVYSKRHELFKFQNCNSNFITNDLRHNTSMITFTFEQKQQLLEFLHKHFRREKLCKNDQYIFKVLLPELCLKIFMDVHNMSEEIATNYLEERPVDVIS